ncbi:universal stress protein [soil metagenome]
MIRNGEVAVLLAARRARAAYSRPVAAVDLSDTARATLELAARVVAPAGRILDVLHVYETPHDQLLRGVAKGSDRAAYYRQCRVRARGTVAELIGEAGATPVIRKLVLRRGDPRRAILEAARAQRADLIALGTHGRSGLPHLLLGSVAEAVMHHAACDVLVARAPRPSKRSAGRAV